MRFAVALAVWLAPSAVLAHASLTYPPARTNEQKAKHCGAAGSVRGTNVTTLAPGATIMVTWNETVDHPGHFRIAFDPDGQDFEQPPTPDQSTEGIQMGVLKDLIPDRQGGGVYMQEITLPDIECTNCTLQFIQVMTDKPPYATDGGINDNDIYYQCADITLSRNAPDAGAGGGGGGGGGGDDAGVGGGGNSNGGGADISGGCSTSGAAGGLPIVLGLVGLLRRRRRA